MVRKFVRLRDESSQADSTYVLRQSRETYRKAICARSEMGISDYHIFQWRRRYYGIRWWYGIL